MHLDSAALAQVPAVPSNPVYAGTGDAVFAYWTLACERDNGRLPKARITSKITAVGASSVTCIALDHSTPDGFSRLPSLLTRPTVATVGLHARCVTWWSGLRYGIFAQIESLRGLDHVSDSVDWTRVRTVAEQSSAHPTRRDYTVDVSKPPLDLLRNEAFLSGCALATYHGRLSLVRVRDVAVTEARDGTLTSAHLRRGRVATLTEVASGLATAYKLRFPSGDVLSVQDAGAIAESGAGATIEATLPAGVYERDDVVTDSAVQSQTIALAQAVLAPFVRPYQVVTWPGDLRLAGHQIGDTLLLSEWLAPDQAGGRGLSSAAGQVLGRRIDLDAGTVDLRLRLSPAAVSGYAPEALVSGISGAVLTLDTATLGAQGFADEGTTDGGASTFAAGDKVCLIEIDATSPAAAF
ncbi:MAG TPA: hypothetical protein VFV33_14450, partial [Gemmatimonadaceae bacterium]|nr:hypothetical protein [Gemmatimonadaceae bacterium]